MERTDVDKRLPISKLELLDYRDLVILKDKIDCCIKRKEMGQKRDGHPDQNFYVCSCALHKVIINKYAGCSSTTEDTGQVMNEMAKCFILQLNNPLLTYGCMFLKEEEAENHVTSCPHRNDIHEGLKGKIISWKDTESFRKDFVDHLHKYKSLGYKGAYEYDEESPLMVKYGINQLNMHRLQETIERYRQILVQTLASRPPPMIPSSLLWPEKTVKQVIRFKERKE